MGVKDAIFPKHTPFGAVGHINLLSPLGPIVFSTQPDKFLYACSIILAVQLINNLVFIPQFRGGAVDFTFAQAVILLAIADRSSARSGWYLCFRSREC